LGLKGSPTSVRTIFSPPVRTGGSVFDNTEDKGRAIGDFLDTFFDKEQRLLDELISEDKA